MQAQKLLVLCLVAAAGLPGLLPDGPAPVPDPPAVVERHELVAHALLQRARIQADAEYWRAVATCLEDPACPLGTCLQAAADERKEALELAHDQFGARLATWEVLGQASYDPLIDPAQFSASVDNLFLPLVPGRTLVYERQTPEGVERIRSTTLHGTVDVAGVTCRVVHDVETLDGELVEDTVDWLAQHANGDVWYFGEISQHFEDGFLDNLEGSWRTGRDGARPGIWMLGAPTTGAVYRQEYQMDEGEDIARIVATNETVTTSYGTFHGCVKIEEWSPLELELEIKYYAPGVGFVLEVNPATGERLELVRIGDG